MVKVARFSASVPPSLADLSLHGFASARSSNARGGYARTGDHYNESTLGPSVTATRYRAIRFGSRVLERRVLNRARGLPL